MAKFYFTYGTAGQPFVGGWTVVEADTRKEACAAFRIYHPDKTPGILNCSSVYSEEEFNRTEMVNGNFHRCCHETITISCKSENPDKEASL